MDEQNPATEQSDANLSSDTLDGSTILSHSEGLLEASAAFEQQMEQMHRWKQQLAGQMDLVRKDGLKLLERQKRLAEERESLARDRDAIAAIKADLEGQLGTAREQAALLQEKIDAAESQQVETAQLESQRAQAREDQRTAEGMLEEIARRQAAADEQAHALSLRAAEIESREKAAMQLEQAVLVQQVQVREMTEQLECQRQSLHASTQAVEERSRKAETLEQELAEQMLLVAQQTKRLAERRAASDLANPVAAASDEAKQHLESITRERDAHEARIRHLVTEINETQSQVAILQADVLRLSAQAQRSDELQREKNSAHQQASALAAELEKITNELNAAREQGQQTEAATSTGDVESLKARCVELETQLAKTSAQLRETLDFVDLQAAEASLAKTTLEASTRDWQNKYEALEQEKGRLTQELASLRAAPAHAGPADVSPRPVSDRHRTVLVRQIRTLRNKRKASRELIGTLETTRNELGKQLQQVRVRRDNLEQVKRLLVKQEMVMARKLADHNAIKTVAAVGIFLIVILGSTFLGVYRFVNPEFRGEALVQLTAPAEVPPDKLDGWLQTQANSLRANPTALNAAWSALRQDGYNMHDTKETWAASLATDLSTPIDSTSHSIAIHVKGSSADGVAQSSNALAAAFAEVAKETTIPAKPDAAPPATAGTIIAKATVPQVPVKDQRMTLALSSSGALMGIALIAVFLVRKLISRQLKEIDRMADAKDLEDLNDDMSVDSSPA